MQADTILLSNAGFPLRPNADGIARTSGVKKQLIGKRTSLHVVGLFQASTLAASSCFCKVRTSYLSTSSTDFTYEGMKCISNYS